MGFAKHLLLQKNAYPTVHPKITSSTSSVNKEYMVIYVLSNLLDLIAKSRLLYVTVYQGLITIHL